MSVETADTSGLFDSTPVFPDWTEEQLEMVGMEITTSSDPSFSSTMSIHVPPSAYYKRLHDDHMALLHCLQTYVPPSRPSSPARETRTDTLKDRVEKAWKSTGGEPTSGRWAQIAWLLRLGCTRGKFVVGGEQMHSVPPREWVLPDTEDEWCKLERGWREDDMRAKKRGTVAEGFASKGDAQTHPPNDDTTEDSDDHVAPKLAVQEQVKGWKVKVPDRVNTASKPVVTLYRDDPPAKTKERDPNDPSPLGFPVIKRPSGTLHAVKKGKPLGLADTPPSRPKDAARRSSTPEREAGPSDIRPRTASPKDLSMADPASSDPSADAPIIADLSEQVCYLILFYVFVSKC
ncbi:hypothetical protein PLICRDRAFT_609314 [Plicaturopsis crispa FD-325 SS-3]|nr:hypothetical protein PLICRDRAFT_609314 [Plicaturopsis crispa FD-325 SS-3]